MPFILATLSNAMLAISIAAIVGCLCIAILLVVWTLADAKHMSIAQLFQRLFWWLTGSPRRRAS